MSEIRYNDENRDGTSRVERDIGLKQSDIRLGGGSRGTSDGSSGISVLNALKLGGFNASEYPRKASPETISGAWDYTTPPTINSQEVWYAGNDGVGSGLDADLLDGQQGSYYLDYNNLTNVPPSQDLTNYARKDIPQTIASLWDYTTPPTINGQKVWYEGDMGAASGLDADLLDGQQGSYYLDYTNLTNKPDLTVYANKTTPQTISGLWNYTTPPTINSQKVWYAGDMGSGSGLDADLLDGNQGSYYLNYNNLTNRPDLNNIDAAQLGGELPSYYLDYNNFINVPGQDLSNYTRKDQPETITALWDFTTAPTVNGNQVWHPGNDGAGSGLDAGLLAGQLPAYYLDYDNLTNKPPDQDLSNYTRKDQPETITALWDFTAAPTINSGTIWYSGNDGAGSGLDADLLDGQQGSYYLDYNNFVNTPGLVPYDATNRWLHWGTGNVNRGTNGVDNLSFGSASGTGSISSNATGALAAGYSIDGTIKCSGSGGLAYGRCALNGNLETSDFGSLTFGNVQGGELRSRGFGSFVLGSTEGGQILTGYDGFDCRGSFALGYASGTGIIRTKSNGSLAFGRALSGNTIEATVTGAIQFFPGTNDVSNSLGVGQSFRFRTDSPTSGQREGDVYKRSNNLYMFIGGAERQFQFV